MVKAQPAENLIFKTFKTSKVKPVLKKNDEFKDFLDWLLAVKKHRVILINEDIISQQASNRRIIMAEMVVAIILIVVMTSLIIFTSVLAFQEPQKMVKYSPRIANEGKNQSMENMVVFIDSNSIVWQFPLSSINSELEKLIKLPYSKQYLGYGDTAGFLTLIDGNMRKPVTILDPTTGQHSTIKSKYQKTYDPSAVFLDMIQTNNAFWIFSQVFVDACKCKSSTEALLWSHKKERFSEDFNIPAYIYAYGLKRANEDQWNRFCYVNLNRTHFLFFGLSLELDDGISRYKKRVFLFDFSKTSWIEWPPLVYSEHPEFFKGCTGLVLFKKNGNMVILVYLQWHYTDQILLNYMELNENNDHEKQWKQEYVQNIQVLEHQIFKKSWQHYGNNYLAFSDGSIQVQRSFSDQDWLLLRPGLSNFTIRYVFTYRSKDIKA